MCLALAVTVTSVTQAEGMKFARFQSGDTIAYGIVEGNRVRQIDGDLFGNWSKTDKTFAHQRRDTPRPNGTPPQVIALAGNYHSHIATGEKDGHDHRGPRPPPRRPISRRARPRRTPPRRPRHAPVDEVPEKFRMPQPFYKRPVLS